MEAVLVKNSDRMMIFANPTREGIEFVFADGLKGMVPFADIGGISSLADLAEIELPNAYELILRNSQGDAVELPWDFVRPYCDASYRPRIEAVAAEGRQSIGSRIRRLREAAGKTQEELAGAAGIGRVTLVRIERGEQSPRYETLVALAGAFGEPLGRLLEGGRA